MVLFLGYLEAYLSHSIKTVDFAEFLSGLEVACQAEYDGSFLYKYVEILVGLGAFEKCLIPFDPEEGWRSLWQEGVCAS